MVKLNYGYCFYGKCVITNNEVAFKFQP